jgi:arylsulfate sulfotransferase
LTPVGTPFEWNYAQHAPVLTPQGTLLVYDDGDSRASPFDPPVPDSANYSRAVEYDINEQTMEVSQVWDYGRTSAERLYTDAGGNADWLPQRGNVLVNFARVMYVNGLHPSPYSQNATMVRIQEVTHDPVPEVVFDLAFFDYGNTNSSYLGYLVYRSHHIPDLYGQLPKPVADLTVSIQNGLPRLEFSADETRTYIVEASIDLLNWEEIGVASEDEQSGDFSFQEEEPSEFPARYYRVVTE